MVLIPPDAGIRMRLQAEANPLQPSAPVAEIPTDLPELRAGQTFTARIQDVLPENTYRALVAGKQITLQLPEGAQAGDSLELVVVDRTPRVVTARLVDTAAAKGAAEPYRYANLSRTGQMIGQLLLAEGETPRPAPLNRGQPLLAQPPASAADLAPALQKAVAQSGLFYEAHQAQWVAGRLPTEQLLREPQGQRSAPAAFAERGLPTPAATDARGAAANAVASSAAPPPPTTLMQVLFGGGEETAAATPQAPAAAAPAAHAIPEELRPLVQQQLDAAATQRLVWHGEVWPNQAMDWEVVREDERGPENGQADEAGWRTTLRLDMPRLGRVEASLRLTAAGIHVSVSAPDDAGAAGLREAAPRLASALDAAGVPLLSFAARHAAE